jgi:hypothetical protein
MEQKQPSALTGLLAMAGMLFGRFWAFTNSAIMEFF